MLNIGEVEDRLEDAKAGIYQLDEIETDPAAEAPPVPEATPEAPPALVSVPPPAE